MASDWIKRSEVKPADLCSVCAELESAGYTIRFMFRHSLRYHDIYYVVVASKGAVRDEQ